MNKLKNFYSVSKIIENYDDDGRMVSRSEIPLGTTFAASPAQAVSFVGFRTGTRKGITEYGSTYTKTTLVARPM